MAYVVEAVSDEDWQRFMADWAADPVKKLNLDVRIRRKRFIRQLDYWVIDREQDSYLGDGPVMLVGGPECGRNFSFFFRKKLYWLELFHRKVPEGISWGGGGSFRRPSTLGHLSLDERTALKTAIKQAFWVHSPCVSPSMRREGYQIVFLNNDEGNEA